MKIFKLIFIIAVIAGLIYGAFCIMDKASTGNYTTLIDYTNEVHSEECIVSHENAGNKPDEFSNLISNILSKLQIEEVPFDSIREMKSWIDQNLSKLNENNGGIQLKEKVDGYLKVIKCIEQSSDRNVGKIQQVANQEKIHLEDCHFKYLQNVWFLGMNILNKPVLINKKEEKVVNSELQKLNTFKSFRDIPSAVDILNRARCKSGESPNRNNSVESNEERSMRW